MEIESPPLDSKFELGKDLDPWISHAPSVRDTAGASCAPGFQIENQSGSGFEKLWIFGSTILGTCLDLWIEDGIEGRKKNLQNDTVLRFGKN